MPAGSSSLFLEPSTKSVFTRFWKDQEWTLGWSAIESYEKFLLIGGVHEGQLSASRKEICFGKHSWCLGNRSSSLSISDKPPSSHPAGIEWRQGNHVAGYLRSYVIDALRPSISFGMRVSLEWEYFWNAGKSGQVNGVLFTCGSLQNAWTSPLYQ